MSWAHRYDHRDDLYGNIVGWQYADFSSSRNILKGAIIIKCMYKPVSQWAIDRLYGVFDDCSLSAAISPEQKRLKYSFKSIKIRIVWLS